MLYYQKQNLYIRLNPDIFEMMEVFSAPGQVRIMRVQNEGIYNQTVQRIADHQFTQITDQEFIPVYINVKNEL